MFNISILVSLKSYCSSLSLAGSRTLTSLIHKSSLSCSSWRSTSDGDLIGTVKLKNMENQGPITKPQTNMMLQVLERMMQNQERPTIVQQVDNARENFTSNQLVLGMILIVRVLGLSLIVRRKLSNAKKLIFRKDFSKVKKLSFRKSSIK